jgi:hypothetical protein
MTTNQSPKVSLTPDQQLQQFREREAERQQQELQLQARREAVARQLNLNEETISHTFKFEQNFPKIF